MRCDELHVTGVDEWTAVANSIVPMDHRYRDRNQWQVTLITQHTTSYSLLRWDQPGDRQAFRTPSHIRRMPAEDFYWLVIPERGSFSVADDREITCVAPGQAVLTGLDQLLRLWVPSSVAFGFQIPRADIDHAIAPLGTRRPVFDLESGLGRIARTMIRETHAERSRLTGRQFNAVCDRTTELLCMMAVGDRSPQRAHLAETAEAVRRYVRDNIGVADLRLAAVARALSWSPRQLRTALEHAGTTYREVRQDESLRAARAMLENPSATLTIGEIAARSGFTVTWFSAAFKTRYGETPREFRKRRLAETLDQPTPAVIRMDTTAPAASAGPR
ncbi:AraC family transcriptional regulator [Nocardia sp. NPDC050630]|uniref:AraC family transcriptional regulator n=1 Tax=Nocardia sp. NPDC050630 TaxID=3364321 RepID=UPI003787F9EB